MKFEKLRTILLTVMFTSIIAFPLINNRFHFIADIKNFENRRLAAEPVFDIHHLDGFPAAYEVFYNDTFSLRFRMVRAFSIYNLLVFQKSSCPDLVIIGNDGWLFLNGEEFDTYTGKNPFSEKELTDFKKELDYRKEYLKKRNCKFYFLIAPAKANIYSEKIPFEMLKKRERSNGEELLDYLKKNSSINVIDLYSVLKENKKNYRTYYSLDNHWSRMGAFYGTNQFLTQACKDFPAVKPLSLNDYTIIEHDSTTGNSSKILSGNMDIYHDINYILKSKLPDDVIDGKKSDYIAPKDFSYPWAYEEVKETGDSAKPKILIISDSFGEYPFELMAKDFKKTVKIWDNWEYKLNEPIVENEKPDIMLLIVHEKNLRSILKNASRLSK